MKQKQQQLISIIIVTWNGINWLKKCLPSINEQSYKKYEIIVVDNGSADGTVEWIQKQYPEVVLVKLKKNYGFAEGNNRGFRKAQGEYVYFLNNDTVLSPNALKEMVELLEKKHNIAGVQSKLLLMEDGKRLDTIGAFMTSTGFLYHNAFSHLDISEYDKEIMLYTLKGASMMFRKSILEKVKVDGYLFDPDYFAYFEETDLCHRIWLSGSILSYAPKAVVWHHMGATSSIIDNNFVQFHSFKNRIMTYIKLLEAKSLIKILFFHFIFIQVFSLILLSRGKFTYWMSIQKAIYWNLINFNKNLKKRKFIFNNIKTKKDIELLPIFILNPPIEYYLSWLKGVPYLKKMNHQERLV